MTEPHEEVAVEDLRAGDLIDLENDEYADPFGFNGTERDPEDGSDEANHMALEYEYAEVEGTEQETPANTLVYTSIINVSFPHGYLVKRYAPDDPEEGGDDDQFGFAELVVDGQRWADSDGETRFPVAEVYDHATRVRDQGYTDVKVEYLDD